MATKTIILENTTVSDLTIRGKSIPASSSVDFTGYQGAHQYQLAQDVIDPLIASGDLVVNNGTTDLTAEEAEVWLYDENFFLIDGITPAPGDVIQATANGIIIAGPLSVENLSNTIITAPAGTQKLQFDGANWVNVNDVITPPAGSEKVIQLRWNPITPLSGTASLPVTSGLPLITDGVEIWSDTLDIQTIGSTVRVTTSVTFTASTSSMEFVFVVYRGTTPVGAATTATVNKDEGIIVTFVVYDVPATTGDTVYSCRVGKNGGPGTWYVNDLPSPATPLGGLLAQGAYTIEEIGVVS